MNLLIVALLHLQIASLKLQLAVQNPTDTVLVADAQDSATQAITESTAALQAYEDSLATSTPPMTVSQSGNSLEISNNTDTPISIPTSTAQINLSGINTQNVMPAIIKAISIEQGPYPLIYAYYSENGINIAGVQLTLSADDAGKITSSGSPDKYKIANDTQLTHGNVGSKGIIGATFEYQPVATGTRTLTITGNGVTQTIQVAGAAE